MRHTPQPVTAAEQQARVEELRHITQAQLDQHFSYCRRYLFDPNGKPYDLQSLEDAFGHALAVAHRCYDGHIALRSYVLIIAKRYLLRELYGSNRRRSVQFSDLMDTSRKCTRSVQFSDLGKDGEQSLYAVEKLPDLKDYFESVETDQAITWANQAESVLHADENNRSLPKWHRTSAHRARLILAMLKESVTQDEGVGLDEYQEPPEPRIQKTYTHGAGKRIHPFTRARLEARLMDLLATDGTCPSKATVQFAMAYLRRTLECILPRELRALLQLG